MSDELAPSSNGIGGEENVDPSLASSLANLNITANSTDSPRVSTVGTDEAHRTGNKGQETNYSMHSEEGADYSAPGLDSLHWAGVKKRGDYDARSIASSMAAEKDDKSIYEEPAVGAVEEEEDDYDDDHAPEEIILPRGDASIDAEPSIAGTVSKQGSITDLNDQLSPRNHHEDYSRPMQSRSIAQSVDAENGSIVRGSEDGEYEDVALQETLDSMAVAAMGTSVASSGMGEPASPHSSAMPPSPVSLPTSMDFAPSSLGAARTMASPNAPVGGYKSKTMQHILNDQEDLDEPKISESLEMELEPEPVVATEEENVALNEEVAPVHANVEEEEEPATEVVIPAAAISEEVEVAPEPDIIVPASSAPVIQHFQIEGGNSGPLPVSAPATSGTQEPAPLQRIDMGPEWEIPFKGLLYYDGVDALGRPVAVVNADCVPPHLKSAALVYLQTHLDPIVNQGNYVLVVLGRKFRLPSLWVMSAYQNLPRPFRKNVQFVILVRPTGFLKWVLAVMKPFISSKAHRKIKTVEELSEIGEVTGGEVTMQHLGPSFLSQADDEATPASP